MQNILPGDSRRIALFIPSLRGGGAERVMVNLANAFTERGIEVDLVLLTSEGPYLKDLSVNVRVVELKASRMITGFMPLVRYLRREKPRVILSAMMHTNVILLLATLVSCTKIPIIISEHSIVSLSLAQNKNIKISILIMLMKWLYPRASYIVAVSKGVADDLSALSGLSSSCFSVIANPIINEKILISSKEAISHPWLENKTVPVILSAGRLTLAKDFRGLIEAFGIARKDRRLRLVILGEGQLKLDLVRLIAELGLTEDIDMPGFVDKPYPYMRHADVFVLSSRWEGFGNVLVEAMVCGTPVISTDCPSGPAEILENGKWGRLVPVGDTNELAHAILDTLDNPGSSPVPRAMEFSVDKAADAYLSLILNVDKVKCGC